jgi:CBS domain-containing protein
MKARHVVTSPVGAVKSSGSMSEVAKPLLQRRISAVPVVDDPGEIRGFAIGRRRRLAFRGGRGAPPEPLPAFE